MIEPDKIQELRQQHTAAFEAEDWPLMHLISCRIIREWARFHNASDEKQKRLLREARELMLAQGESIDVPIQFRQHGWLNETNELLKPMEKENSAIVKAEGKEVAC